MAPRLLILAYLPHGMQQSNDEGLHGTTELLFHKSIELELIHRRTSFWSCEHTNESCTAKAYCMIVLVCRNVHASLSKTFSVSRIRQSGKNNGQQPGLAAVGKDIDAHSRAKADKLQSIWKNVDPLPLFFCPLSRD